MLKRNRWGFFVKQVPRPISEQSGAAASPSVPALSLGKLHPSFIFQSRLPLWGVSEACDATADCAVSKLSRCLCLHRGSRREKHFAQTHKGKKWMTRGASITARLFFPTPLGQSGPFDFYHCEIRKGCLACFGVDWHPWTPSAPGCRGSPGLLSGLFSHQGHLLARSALLFFSILSFTLHP